jgi:hypothetical protein
MSNNTPPAPDVMTWRHDGYSLLLDEDGLSVLIHKERRFEACEVHRLIEQFAAVEGQAAEGFAAPHRPSPEQVAGLSYLRAERRVIEQGIRDLRKRLADLDSPF